MKLRGKELDAEIAKRRQSKNDRIAQRIGIRDAAKQRGISATDLLAYEYGYDVCPHEKWVDQVGGFPVPKLIFKQCKKCGKVDEKTTEKVNDANLGRVYKVFKKAIKKLSNGLKENKDVVKKEVLE